MKRGGKSVPDRGCSMHSVLWGQGTWSTSGGTCGLRWRGPDRLEGHGGPGSISEEREGTEGLSGDDMPRVAF